VPGDTDEDLLEIFRSSDTLRIPEPLEVKQKQSPPSPPKRTQYWWRIRVDRSEYADEVCDEAIVFLTVGQTN
jgi:hypothetical protein